MKILPVGCCPGILYGQPEVHKAVINNYSSFTPILDAINTSSYKLAKFTIKEYFVRDSFVLAKEITMTDCNYFIAKFNVENLFTKVFLPIYL